MNDFSLGDVLMSAASAREINDLVERARAQAGLANEAIEGAAKLGRWTCRIDLDPDVAPRVAARLVVLGYRVEEVVGGLSVAWSDREGCPEIDDRGGPDPEVELSEKSDEEAPMEPIQEPGERELAVPQGVATPDYSWWSERVGEDSALGEALSALGGLPSVALTEEQDLEEAKARAAMRGLFDRVAQDLAELDSIKPWRG